MNVIDKTENKYIKTQIKDKLRNRKEILAVSAVKTAKNGRSGGTRTHGLQYPKLARYHLRYASIIEKIRIWELAHKGEFDDCSASLRH